MPKPCFTRQEFLASAIAVAAFPKLAQADVPVVHLATYSHIDVAWRWPMQEGLQQSDSTFRSVLNVLDTFPELKFSETSASYYAWIRTTDPTTYARIARLVSAQRWEPVGGWWTEADVNIVSGESLMRQAWFGQREFREHLGVTTAVAFLPDSFGSSANLPAILRAQGFRYYVLGRGAFANQAVPSGAFEWRSLGSSSIVAYNNPVSGGSNDVIATVSAAAQRQNGLLVWFGLGDHGGGPTIQSLTLLTQYLKTSNAPRVTFSRVEPYLRALPVPNTVLQGEIEGVFPGAFTNCYDIKRSNIDAERALLDCERYDVLADLCVGGLPTPGIDELWEALLLNQHHDTISATGPQANVESAVAQNRAVAQRATDKASFYLECIVDRVPHSPEDDAMLVVFNPLSHPASAVVSYPLSVPPGKVPNIFDASGAPVQSQVASSEDVIYLSQSAPTCISVDLPAFGYASYRVRGFRDAPPSSSEESPSTLASSSLRITIDKSSGLPSQLHDSTGTLALSKSRFAVFSDREDTWGSDLLPTQPEFGSFDMRSFRLVEQGPVRTVCVGAYEFRNSRLDVRTELRTGERALRFTIDVDWQEPFMRLAFAADVAGTSASYDIPFGVIERPAAEKLQPGISFVARTRPQGYVAIVACGNHGFWASTATMGVTLARSCPYSSLGSVDPNAKSFQDLGKRRISIMLALADDVPELQRISEAFERTFPVLWNGVHNGSAPQRRGFLSVPQDVAVASLRRTGADVEARLHNLEARPSNVRGRLGSTDFNVAIDSYGIRTLRRHGDHFEDTTPS